MLQDETVEASTEHFLDGDRIVQRAQVRPAAVLQHVQEETVEAGNEEHFSEGDRTVQRVRSPIAMQQAETVRAGKSEHFPEGDQRLVYRLRRVCSDPPSKGLDGDSLTFVNIILVLLIGD